MDADAPHDVRAWREHTDTFNRWFAGSRIVDTSGRPLLCFHGTTVDFDEFVAHAPQSVYYVNGVEVQEANSWDMGDDRQGLPLGYHYMALGDAVQLGPARALAHRQEESRGTAHPDTLRLLRDLQRLQGAVVRRETEVRPTGDGFYFTPDAGYSYIRDIGRRDGGRVLPVYLAIRNPIFLNASQIEGAGRSWNVAKYRALGHDGAIYAEDPTDLTRRGWFGGSPQIVAFDSRQVKSRFGLSFDPRSPKIDDNAGTAPARMGL